LNDTSVFPVALLENAVTRPIHIKAKKYAVLEPMRCPFPMNCLFSTCRLTLIPAGWSATRKLLQKSRYVPINHALSETYKLAVHVARRFFDRLIIGPMTAPAGNRKSSLTTAKIAESGAATFYLQEV